MMRQARLQQLIDLIYEAAIKPKAWHDFVEALSEAFDGAAVLLGVPMAADARLAPRYTYGLQPGYRDSFVENLIEGLPWKSRYVHEFRDRFGFMSEFFPSTELRHTGFYTDWLKPQALAPRWPICHTIVIEGGVVAGGILLYRPDDCDPGPFRKADLAMGDALVRHLSRAFNIHATLGGVERERLALAEVMDRLPTGVILVDSRRRSVVTNQSADRIIALDDGFRVGESGPTASSARENAILQKLLADVLEETPGGELGAGGFLAVSRPSGKRAYPVMVTPLLAAPAASTVRDAAAAIFVSDPEGGLASPTEVLEVIYSLTHSEAELVRLLSQGKSLDEVAEARGISINTARSHLKRVFAKTDTRRQGELVRLVLTGVASLADDAE